MLCFVRQEWERQQLVVIKQSYVSKARRDTSDIISCVKWYSRTAEITPGWRLSRPSHSISKLGGKSSHSQCWRGTLHQYSQVVGSKVTCSYWWKKSKYVETVPDDVIPNLKVSPNPRGARFFSSSYCDSAFAPIWYRKAVNCMAKIAFQIFFFKTIRQYVIFWCDVIWYFGGLAVWGAGI